MNALRLPRRRRVADPPPLLTFIELMRRHSTAAVLFHHALAERMGLGPTDHKCLDVLRERGTMTGSELADVTGLTTGAITGVVARLQQAGFLTRKADPQDGRKQRLSLVGERTQAIHETLAPLRHEMTALLQRFSERQRATIHAFLDEATDSIYRQVALLRTAPGQPIARAESRAGRAAASPGAARHTKAKR